MSSPPAFDLQIPPARSPLLLPSDHLRNRRNDSTESFLLPSGHDFDEMEFMAPGDWEEREGDSDSDDEGSLEDWSLEDGHIEGIPAANVRLEAKEYQTPEFAANLLELLRCDLRIIGWSTLPREVPASLLHIHKVSGSLTNAVFFVSIPKASIELPVSNYTAPTSPVERASPSSIHEADQSRDTSLPNTFSYAQNSTPIRTLTVEAPTMLLRIYGPSSGSLISRKTELHILHTLSSDYAIGPRVLGTFSNGRVEEYFHSRALHKEEMRDPRMSRWIGRRMRELHRVELEKMEVPGASGSSGHYNRPPLDVGGRGSASSINSMYSTSSGSSIFSFGTSNWSTSSAGSSSSIAGSDYGTPLSHSPQLLPRRGSTESRADSKKRSRFSIANGRHGRAKDKLGVWENITRWTREAKLVLKELDQIADIPGITEAYPSPIKSSTSQHIPPLATPALTLALRETLNLPLFEQQVKLYRRFVRDWEKSAGKSKRIFSHNDTQYGNLLLLTPPADGDESLLERSLQAPHQKIIVVDFEYASANPRGFDIANHFIEWQADYHHPTLSHSLLSHAPYPTELERLRFLRAYIGCDSGYDGADDRIPEIEDPRVARLQEEVELWEPSSHAMWATWGIVQAKEDLMAKIEKWKSQSLKRVQVGLDGLALNEESDLGEGRRPTITRGKSGEVGEEIDQDGEGEVEPEADFDYLSYSLMRLTLFREELEALGVI